MLPTRTLRNTRDVLRYVWQHPANQGRRLPAVARALAFQARGRIGRRTVARIGTTTRMYAVLHRAASSKVVYANPPDYPEMMAWRRVLRPRDLFIDVGSNVGTYALWAADCGASVVAVEPSRSAVELLTENIALNDKLPRIDVRRCALADTRGEMRLSEGLDSTNHLLPEGGGGQVVSVDTLDDLLGDQTATGVKVDVEGAEHLVLKGAVRALSEHRIGVLQLEWNDRSLSVLGETREPVAAMLRGYGYVLCRPDAFGVLRPTGEAEGFGADVFAVAPNLIATHLQ